MATAGPAWTETVPSQEDSQAWQQSHLKAWPGDLDPRVFNHGLIMESGTLELLNHD